MQCALSSSLISLMAETIASTALVCPKHAVLSLSVLTSISGAAGSFCWHLSSSFVRSGMRETLVICNKYTFIQLSQNETRTTLLRKQLRTILSSQMALAVVSRTREYQRNWFQVDFEKLEQCFTIFVCFDRWISDRKLNSSKSIRASWLTGIDYDK
ncbi:Hypothetical_protein [Hexamita inflata]|uniref:Hypothetical_protein n=1 Tax=Hexamita inflata TaxID=28002 RepID=A0AA86Q087_9EUKA|nr:Hypothetical protein HINF_LOCUS34763 [Hexamita inflata]